MPYLPGPIEDAAGRKKGHELTSAAIKDTREACPISLIPGFCNDYVPKSEKGILPHPVTNLFMEEMLEADYLDLLQTYKLVFNCLSISLEQTLELEEATRGQCQSKLWFQHRAAWACNSVMVEGCCSYRPFSAFTVTHKADLLSKKSSIYFRDSSVGTETRENFP